MKISADFLFPRPKDFPGFLPPAQNSMYCGSFIIYSTYSLSNHPPQFCQGPVGKKSAIELKELVVTITKLNSLKFSRGKATNFEILVKKSD